MSIYDDMQKLNSDGYEEAYISCNDYWKEKVRGKRSEMNVVDDAACIYIDELIKYWNDALPPMVDYADMVCAPEWAYGCNKVKEEIKQHFMEME